MAGDFLLSKMNLIRGKTRGKTFCLLPWVTPYFPFPSGQGVYGVSCVWERRRILTDVFRNVQKFFHVKTLLLRALRWTRLRRTYTTCDTYPHRHDTILSCLQTSLCLVPECCASTIRQTLVLLKGFSPQSFDEDISWFIICKNRNTRCTKTDTGEFKR